MLKKLFAGSMVLLILLSLFPVKARGSEPLQSGDRVVIWSEAFGVALSAESSGDFRAGVPVSMEDGTLRGYSESEIWTVTENEDGSWCFENDGARLSLDETSWKLTLNGAYSGWNIQDLGDGTCRIINGAQERYLTWYSAREVYAVASVLQEQNILRLWILPEAPEETESSAEETTEPIATQPPEKALDTGDWELYFGQLHAHTADSDGVGTVEEAFTHASGVEGLDFFAVTDHSDSFDNDREGTLTEDGSAVSAQWAAGKAAAEAVTNGDFVGLYGFEMSWDQGQGHISTFNTPGFLSRDREGYSLYSEGLENYYEALMEVPDSVSQFNHPGTVYGDFKNFAWYSDAVDALVTLIEVGSGVGAEYRTAYEYYTRALDRGWHLAPSDNQNNHDGNFGDGDSGRTVVLASELTEAGIYDALRHYRVYATEDSDLQIYYTLNGAVMGSELSAAKAGNAANIAVRMYDPTDAEWGTVEVITSGGAVAASAGATECVTFSLPTTAAYYYIRITQADGDIAVTAPVWIRQKDDLGISVLETETALTRAGENQNILLKLYNNEGSDLTVTGITLADQDGNVLGLVSGERVVPQFETLEVSFPVCFETDGVYTLTAAVSAVFEGESRALTRELEVSVLPVPVTSNVVIDGTHGAATDYGELQRLAADRQISVCVETDRITAEQLAECRLLVIPVPRESFEDAFLELVLNYVNQSGNLLLLGTAGGSTEINRLLETLEMTMTLNPDTARDEVSNGGQPDQLYTSEIGKSAWTEGILEGQTYAHVGGCTLNPGAGVWLVRSRTGEVLLAAERNVMLAGSDFLADRWLGVSDNSWALPYANRTIAENLLGITRTEPRITPIGQVRAGELGRVYLVEGRITAGTHNPSTTFPNTIYLQDATGGIAAVGYSEHGLELGRRVRIIGSLEETGGNPQLRILSMEIFEKQEPVVPGYADTLDAARGGELFRLEGTVVSAEADGEAVNSFVIANAEGKRTTVWIGDAIFSGSLGWNELGRKVVQVGNQVSAVGICHLMEGEAVLRVRDCDEILLLWAPVEETVPVTTQPVEETTEVPTEPPTEIPTDPEVPQDTDGNPPTGDDGFPAWAVMSLLLSLAGLLLLFRYRKCLV